MEPYHRRKGEQDILPPPELEDEDEYEVEEILDEQRRQGAFWYKVRWKGWPEEYDQWLPQENLENAQELLRQFKQKRAQANTNRRRRGGEPRKRSTRIK
ncbi:uncharacterized protein PV09_09560 [Verruconis gallopava]|uniref:Chromo domain-containing protein n=1 Tax=Verruconis gallopava TaxID=253628 RepID=A0A0D1X979_9PEZI|nr:uncharacterized protein PV09_09560 [Verruconis gallopava]KIV98680.1 hypothetical protein PV09_09560 [Verruconis gallopava]